MECSGSRGLNKQGCPGLICVVGPQGPAGPPGLPGLSSVVSPPLYSLYNLTDLPIPAGQFSTSTLFPYSNISNINYFTANPDIDFVVTQVAGRYLVSYIDNNPVTNGYVTYVLINRSILVPGSTYRSSTGDAATTYRGPLNGQVIVELNVGDELTLVVADIVLNSVLLRAPPKRDFAVNAVNGSITVIPLF